MASHSMFRVRVPISPAHRRVLIWTARSALLVIGAFSAYTAGPWAGLTYAVVLPLVMLTRPSRAADQDDSAASTRKRTRREVPGSHSGATDPGAPVGSE